MRLSFRYELRGAEPRTVDVEPFAIIEYERSHERTIRETAARGVSVEDMTEFVWRQLLNDGTLPAGTELDAFARQLVDIGPPEVPTKDPTSPETEASPDSS